MTFLDFGFDRQFRDQLADPGTFSFSVLEDDAAGLAFDDIIQFRLNGQAEFQGIVEHLDYVTLAPGEEADHVVKVSGRGALALLDQAVVYPSRGVGALPVEEVRSFSWPTPDFVDSSWPLAKQVNRQRDYATWRAPLPWIWPDTTGYWIWANLASVTSTSAPVGTCLFRKSFTLADDETVRIFCAFDNSGTLYVDGAEMTAFNGFEVGRYVQLELSAGTHYIAASAYNRLRLSPGPNPGGFIAAVYTVGDAGLLGALVTHTNATWKCLPYPATNPGFTHGKVLIELIAEAQAQGALTGVTYDFSETIDSGGNPWGAYQEITVQVGRSVLAAVQEMSDTFIDVAMAPGSLTLRAWDRGGRGTAQAVTLQQTDDTATSDFLALSHSGKRTRMNAALIRYAGGFIEETDPASISTYDFRGAYLELGAVQGEAEARQVAVELMANRALPSFSTVARLKPHNAAATPYDGYGMADTIDCPDETGTPAPMRVCAITMDEGSEGDIEWPVELRDQELELEERHDVWLRRMADGAVLGGARVSSRAGTPAPITQQVTALRVAEFSYDNSALLASLSPRRPAETSGNMVEIYAELTTAGSSNTVVRVYLKLAGVVGLGTILGTLTLGSGVTEAETPLTIVPIRANVDKLQAQIVTVGTGAAGLDIQVRAI